ncbi:MAG: SPOR domain-containing protein [Spirochaetes bacterium]|nr:SPOR domain-containing protein [Spirochaetota bacterium]
MTRKHGFFLLLALAFLASAWSQTTTTIKKTAAAPATLSAARQALTKKVGTESFASLLESYALALGPRDAVALISEFAPKAPESKRQGLYSISASVSMVLGDYGPAALALIRSADGNADLLLKACRCYLAAGDQAQAAKTLVLVPDSQNGKTYLEAKHLTSAWASLLSGKAQEAFDVLKSLALKEGEAETRREALFLLWMIASSSEIDTIGTLAKGWSAPEILALLRDKYPGSMELAAAESKIAMKPSAWLLSSVYPLSVDEGDRSLTGLAPAAQGETAAVATLQVGWFSREENARSLASTLKSKGFQASVDERSVSGTEKRWAVLIETSGGWTQVQAKLKDLGYESYLVP